MIAKLCAWAQSRDGVTGVEYALISAAIGLTTMVIATMMGDQLTNIFDGSIFEGIGGDSLQ